MKDDPRIAAIQEYFADERQAGRMIFSFEDDRIAAILAIADRSAENEHIRRVTQEVAGGI